MRKNTLFLIRVSIILLLLGLSLVSFLPIKSRTIAHVLLAGVERKSQKNIEFNTSRVWIPGNIFLGDVSITDERGRLYHIDAIDIRYNLPSFLFKKRQFHFNLKGIKLYQDMGLLDSVAGMLAISAMPDVEFDVIEGTFELHKNAIFIKDIYVHNDKIRIRGSGWMDNDGSLDCDVNFSFSKDVTDMIPDAVKVTLLRREKTRGWMGIDFKVKGNYKKPTLHITSDTLKLNIMEGLFGNE